MKIRPVEAVLFHAEGRADRHYETHFSQFYGRAKKITICVSNSLIID